MSAGRKKQDPLDRYDTPPAVTRAFLNAWAPFVKPTFMLEPAAGRGSIMRVLAEWNPPATVLGFDIAPRAPGIIQHDFLMGDTPEATDGPDLIITNPPFRIAEHFLRRAMELVRPHGHVVFLLRAAFLETRRRWNLLEQYPPTEVYFLRKRPRFTGPNSEAGGSDTAMYAWFVWRQGERPQHFEGYVL